jgi:hypothetical protein
MDIVESKISDIQQINAKIDKETAAILQKMIHRNPVERFQNCQEIMDALGTVTQKQAIKTIEANLSKVKTHKQASKIDDQVTQININNENTSISNSPEKLKAILSKKKPIFAIAITLSVILLYFIFSNKDTQNYLSTDFVGNDILVPKQQATINDTFLADQLIDDSEVENNAEQQLNEPSTVIIEKNCLEISAINILKKEKGSWSLKKPPKPPTQLLNSLRQQIVRHLQKSSKLTFFDAIKNRCSTAKNQYRLLLEVTAYKKPRKTLPKTGLGREKITVNASLIRKKTNKIIAQKRLTGRGITMQLNNNKSEFMTAITLFLKSALE